MSFLVLTVAVKLLVKIFQLKGFFLYFAIFALSFFGILLTKISPIKGWLKSMDIAFFNSVFVQSLLLRSLQLETLYYTKNPVDFLCAYCTTVFFGYYAIAGFIALLDDSINNVVDLFAVLCFFWFSIYIRLRFKYLNYDYLQLDQIIVSWEDFLKQFQSVDNLCITNKVGFNPDLRVFSLKRRGPFDIPKREFGAGASKIVPGFGARFRNIASNMPAKEDLNTVLSVTAALVSSAVGVVTLHEKFVSNKDEEIFRNNKEIADALANVSSDLKETAVTLKKAAETNQVTATTNKKVVEILRDTPLLQKNEVSKDCEPKQVSFFSEAKLDFMDFI